MSNTNLFRCMKAITLKWRGALGGFNEAGAALSVFPVALCLRICVALQQQTANSEMA